MYTSTFQYIFLVWCLINDTKSFTFYLQILLHFYGDPELNTYM